MRHQSASKAPTKLRGRSPKKKEEAPRPSAAWLQSSPRSLLRSAHAEHHHFHGVLTLESFPNAAAHGQDGYGAPSPLGEGEGEGGRPSASSPAPLIGARSTLPRLDQIRFGGDEATTPRPSPRLRVSHQLGFPRYWDNQTGY
ncbi:hypothetical protein BRADI_3g30461v3 [Brachypodium distachyon]|uniref:Uncharacterized protein n=1 Tax=Brachypodium distachyon TaxID=15368 RepID=A0A2K2D088_BRADI|nr:hypothetical protein BRADI_3g30461v3 [Brachypodium distachyon]